MAYLAPPIIAPLSSAVLGSSKKVNIVPTKKQEMHTRMASLIFSSFKFDSNLRKVFIGLIEED